MDALALVMPKRARSRTRPPVSAHDGYVLVPVVMGLLMIALAALILNNESVINVAEVGGLHEAARAEHVAQSGMERALWRAEHDACGGDFAIAATALGSAQYEVTATGAASSTTYRLSADQDAWISSDDTARNNGSSNTNHIRFESAGTDHALTRFGLSSVPANAQIQSATAWFYIKGSTPHPEGPISVHAITADWGELTVTWDSFAGAFSPDRLATISAQDSGGVWVGINLTAQVQAWVNGAPNFGILFQPTSDGTHTEYTGRADGTNPPRLEVVAGNGAMSPLALSATGSLRNGVARTLVRMNTPALQPANVLTLRPGPTDGKDAYTWAANKNTNYETDDETWVATGTNNTALALFEFPTGQIPAQARISRAALSVHHRSGYDSNVPITAHRITRTWNENEVSWIDATWANMWTTRGGDFDRTAVATTLVGPASYQRYEWDITSLVRGWVEGDYPNYGVILQTEEPGIFGERFDTSDHVDPTRRPSLTIEFACECGSPCMAPQGLGTITMVVINPTTLVASDAYKKALFESWGYTVDVIGESANQGAYDAKAAASNIFFISETVNSNQVGGRIKDVPIGVVSQDGDYNSDLGIAGGSTWPVGPAIEITDPSHYITAIFPAGPLEIYTGDMEQLTISGGAASGLQTLAETGGAPSLVALETGAALLGGGNASGRRVMLPLGREGGMSWDHLNSNGQLIVQRAISWAMGAGGPSGGLDLLLVVGNPGSLNAQENAKKGLIESWGYTVNLIDESDLQSDFDTAIAANDVAYIPQDINSANLGTKLVGAAIGVVNEEGEQVDELGFSDDKLFKSQSQIDVVDNSHYITQPFSTGLLTFSGSDQSVHMLNGNYAPGLSTLGETLNTGSLWKPSLGVLDTGADLVSGGSAAGRRVQLPWGGGTFDINALTDDGRTIMERAIRWAAGAGNAPLLPIAHWKLDDGAGSTAIDSEGGHHGTLTNGPAWTTGQIDGGLSFDGTDDYVEVPHDDNLSLSSFSISAWIYPSALSGWQIIVNKGTSTSAVNYYLAINGDEIGLGFYNAGWLELNTATANLSTGQWYHVVGTYEDMTRRGTVYLDGTEIFTDTVTRSPLPNSQALTVGRSAFGEYWTGTLDDVRIYDRSLSSTQVSALFAEGGAGGGGGGGGSFVCSGTYVDRFDAQDFAGSNGSLDWSATPWIEVGESDGATSGDVAVENDSSDFQLKIQDNDNGGEGVERAVNLGKATAAKLGLRYRRDSLDNSDDYVALLISTNGTAGPWTELHRFGTSNDTSYQSFQIDISSFVSDTTAIRLQSAATLGRNDRVFFDDIEIECSP